MTPVTDLVPGRLYRIEMKRKTKTGPAEYLGRFRNHSVMDDGRDAVLFGWDGTSFRLDIELIGDIAEVHEEAQEVAS